MSTTDKPSFLDQYIPGISKVKQNCSHATNKYNCCIEQVDEICNKYPPGPNKESCDPNWKKIADVMYCGNLHNIRKEIIKKRWGTTVPLHLYPSGTFHQHITG